MHISIIVIMTIITEQVLTELSRTTERSGEGPIQWIILSQVAFQCSSTDQSGHNMMHQINKYHDLIQYLFLCSFLKHLGLYI